MRCAAQPEGGGLLRVLLVWQCAVSFDARWREAEDTTAALRDQCLRAAWFRASPAHPKRTFDTVTLFMRHLLLCWHVLCSVVPGSLHFAGITVLRLPGAVLRAVERVASLAAWDVRGAPLVAGYPAAKLLRL